jgi:hypothetical protein
MAAFEAALRFESALRERLIAKLSRDSSWWRDKIPSNIRGEANLRRKRDRSSSFAARVQYHQIYYCYLDDLLKILLHNYQEYFAGLTEPRPQDLSNRFEELVALRNRIAHGRLLLPDEGRRVNSLVAELSAALDVSSVIEFITFEDPLEICLDGRAYISEVQARMADGLQPDPPSALTRVRGASTLQESFDDVELQVFGRLEAALVGAAAIEKLPGFRLEVARIAKQIHEQGLISASEQALARVCKELE